MNIINPITIKPGTVMQFGDKVDLMSGAAFPVKAGDNGILLLIEAVEGGEVTVSGGTSVFGGGDKTFYVYTGNAVIWLESGRFAQTEGEYKDHVLVRANGEHYARVIQLV